MTRTLPFARIYFMFLLCLSIALLAGCSPESGPPDTAPPPEAGPPGSELPAADTAMAHPGIELTELLSQVSERTPEGRLEVLDVLRPPTRITHRPVENRHDPSQTDTIHTYVYPGLRIEVYDVAASDTEIIQTIEVTSTDYRTASGLTIGDTRAEVRDALGAPAREENGTLFYERPQSPQDPTPPMLRIRFDNDYVQAMTWEFYVD